MFISFIFLFIEKKDVTLQKKRMNKKVRMYLERKKGREKNKEKRE